MKHNSVSRCFGDVSEPTERRAGVNTILPSATQGQLHVLNAAMERENETLVYEAAHDLRNILYVIRGFTELLLEAVQADSKPYSHLRNIVAAVDRGSRLVGHMLTYAQKCEAEKRPIDIIPVVEETLSFVRASVPQTVSVRLRYSQDMRPVRANPTEIHQLLMNLCSNAAHAMRDGGGTLTVTLERVELDACSTDLHPRLKPGPYLRLTVSDTGTGMSAAIVEHIFNPYFTTKPRGQGTGLGLCVVQRIVKGHGGEITVHSVEGKGTTCHAYFPTVTCASPSCSSRRMASYTTIGKEFGMGLLKDDLQHLRTDMDHIHGDLEHLEKDIEQAHVECGSHFAELLTHVRDLEDHLYNVLAHVAPVQDACQPLDEERPDRDEGLEKAVQEDVKAIQDLAKAVESHADPAGTCEEAVASS